MTMTTDEIRNMPAHIDGSNYGPPVRASLYVIARLFECMAREGMGTGAYRIVAMREVPPRHPDHRILDGPLNNGPEYDTVAEVEYNDDGNRAVMGRCIDGRWDCWMN